MNADTKRNIKRLRELNKMPASTLSEKENKEFYSLCVLTVFPLLQEVDRLNEKIKQLKDNQ
jgi:hypothetical protein